MATAKKVGILLICRNDDAEQRLQCDELFIKNVLMLLHHIKPEQFSQLEEMFGKKTDLGLQIPPWLLRLKETSKTPPKDEEFECTVPGDEDWAD